VPKDLIGLREKHLVKPVFNNREYKLYFFRLYKDNLQCVSLGSLLWSSVSLKMLTFLGFFSFGSFILLFSLLACVDFMNI